MEKQRLQKLEVTLTAYRKQFRTATPLERSVLLMAMRALMEEVETLARKKEQLAVAGAASNSRLAA